MTFGFKYKCVEWYDRIKNKEFFILINGILFALTL